MKTKINRLMAYVYMPLIFTIIGFGILYIALNPVLDLVVAVSAMAVSDDIPAFSKNLESIFEEPDIQDVDEQEDEIKMSTITWPKYGRHYAVISCEKIGMNANVYMGDDSTIIKAGVGQYFGSFIPGYGKPIVLDAHCTTYFAPLEFIEDGDVVTITTSYGVYQYEVYEHKVVEPPFLNVIDLTTDEEILTMYTCYPFKLLSGSRKRRLFVYAKKIAGPTLVN